MPIQIADRMVGVGQPCFVVAEAGVNHNGRVDLALQLVDVAKQAGADAVKFQTFKAESVVASHAPKAAYQVANTHSNESQLEMIKGLELSFDEFRQVHRYCGEQQILFLSTPFDAASADFLDELGMAGFKIPSGEITNTPFLAHIASKRKPIVLSTGMSTFEEVREALNTIYATGNHDVVILHCVSNYPASPSSINLRAMATMRREFQLDVGYSDHTEGIEVALAAVALGACVIEKHFTLDRNLPGPDQRASIEPRELNQMVASIRNVETCLGSGVKAPAAEEFRTAECARRSLVAARRISAGTVITDEMIQILRPGTGLPPGMKPEVVGKRLVEDIEAGGVFLLRHFA